MITNDIIRAWKDRDYRDSLNDEQRALLPDNPIGEVLSDDELQGVDGAGTWTLTYLTTVTTSLIPTTETTVATTTTVTTIAQ